MEDEILWEIREGQWVGAKKIQEKYLQNFKFLEIFKII